MNVKTLIMFAALVTLPRTQFDYSYAKQKTPDVIDVQKRALAYARLDPNEIDKWKKKVRLAPLLPKLQVDYSRKLRNNIDIKINDSVYVGSGGTIVGPDQGTLQEYVDQNNDVTVRAVWSLNEAIFNTDMLSVSEETRQLARERTAILAEVNKNYYEREKKAGEIDFLKKELKRGEDVDKIKKEIFASCVAIDEATSALDALTGGWFSTAIGSLGKE